MNAKARAAAAFQYFSAAHLESLLSPYLSGAVRDVCSVVAAYANRLVVPVVIDLGCHTTRCGFAPHVGARFDGSAAASASVSASESTSTPPFRLPYARRQYVECRSLTARGANRYIEMLLRVRSGREGSALCGPVLLERARQLHADTTHAVASALMSHTGLTPADPKEQDCWADTNALIHHCLHALGALADQTNAPDYEREINDSDGDDADTTADPNERVPNAFRRQSVESYVVHPLVVVVRHAARQSERSRLRQMLVGDPVLAVACGGAVAVVTDVDVTALGWPPYHAPYATSTIAAHELRPQRLVGLPPGACGFTGVALCIGEYSSYATVIVDGTPIAGATVGTPLGAHTVRTRLCALLDQQPSSQGGRCFVGSRSAVAGDPLDAAADAMVQRLAYVATLEAVDAADAKAERELRFRFDANTTGPHDSPEAFAHAERFYTAKHYAEERTLTAQAEMGDKTARAQLGLDCAGPLPPGPRAHLDTRLQKPVLIGAARYRCAESLWQPRLDGVDVAPVQSLVARAVFAAKRELTAAAEAGSAAAAAVALGATAAATTAVAVAPSTAASATVTGAATATAAPTAAPTTATAAAATAPSSASSSPGPSPLDPTRAAALLARVDAVWSAVVVSGALSATPGFVSRLTTEMKRYDSELPAVPPARRPPCASKIVVALRVVLAGDATADTFTALPALPEAGKSPTPGVPLATGPGTATWRSAAWLCAHPAFQTQWLVHNRQSE